MSASATEGKADFLEHMDTDAIAAWVNKYCGNYPLETISSASRKLLIELMERFNMRNEKEPPQ